jgi:hypothetical protein
MGFAFLLRDPAVTLDPFNAAKRPGNVRGIDCEHSQQR